MLLELEINEAARFAQPAAHQEQHGRRRSRQPHRRIKLGPGLGPVGKADRQKPRNRHPARHLERESARRE